MTFKKAKYLIVLLVLFHSCGQEEENPLTVSPQPVIDTVRIPLKWNTRSGTLYKVEARVLDAQGFSNIASVSMTVYDSQTSAEIFRDSLYDDATFYHPQDGDVVAGDGVFSNRFKATGMVPAQTEGNYRFLIMATDQEGNQSKEIIRTVFFGPNDPPGITSVTAPDTFSTLSDAIITVHVNDSEGIADIERVYFESQFQTARARRYEADLYNDGNYEQHGDQTAGDSVFSVRLDTTFTIGKLGNYYLFFYVLDSFMEQNSTIPQHTIFVGNTAPQILNVAIPDTMHRPVTAGTYNRKLITAQVYDAQGLGDIDSVYFYSLKPDSTFANNGLPILLVDNGYTFNPNNPGVEAGDQKAGDGIYSFSLLVASNTLTGFYTFTFYVRDKAGNLSTARPCSLEIVEGN